MPLNCGRSNDSDPFLGPQELRQRTGDTTHGHFLERMGCARMNLELAVPQMTNGGNALVDRHRRVAIAHRNTDWMYNGAEHRVGQSRPFSEVAKQVGRLGEQTLPSRTRMSRFER